MKPYIVLYLGYFRFNLVEREYSLIKQLFVIISSELLCIYSGVDIVMSKG